MGYPPIKGFDSILVAETAKIAGYLQSTTGKIVGHEESYLDRQAYLLITARVKGGNSGGPVISSEGMVCGIVAQLPADENGADTLGYAVVIPITTLKHILENCSNSSEQVQSLRFTLNENGFKTTK
jgi:serine protease Do